jgi:hypothetical protein
MVIRLIHEFEEMTPEKRPQDPQMDGSGLRFETLEHGGYYPDTMPQAIRITDQQGRSCTYVPIKVDGKVVDSKCFTLERADDDNGATREKRAKTPDEIADDQERTTALGLFNLAEAYWKSAIALQATKVNSGYADDPRRFLFYHAIELYLKAFLRGHGLTVGQLEQLGHKTGRLTNRARKLGLSLTERDSEVFAIMANTDAVIRSRYIRTGAFTWPRLEALDDACQNLRDEVGSALRKAGLVIWL